MKKHTSPLRRLIAIPHTTGFFDVAPSFTIYGERVPEYDDHHAAGRRWALMASVGWGFWHLQFTLFV
jgi:hypothetical protein